MKTKGTDICLLREVKKENILARKVYVCNILEQKKSQGKGKAIPVPGHGGP
jgi:hypothetical protein